MHSVHSELDITFESIQKPFISKSSNKEHPSSEPVDSQLTFMRMFAAAFRSTAASPHKELPLTNAMWEKVRKAPSSIKWESDLVMVTALAKFMKAGNCWEQSAIAYTRFLTFDFRNHAEYIKIKPAESKESDDAHDLLVFYRGTSSDIKKPETWPKGTVIFDLWGTRAPYDVANKAITTETLAKQGNLDTEHVKYVVDVLAAINKPCTIEQYTFFIDRLKALHEFVSKSYELIEGLINTTEANVKDVKKFVSDFKESIQLEIKAYEKLLKVLKPSSPGLFGSKPGASTEVLGEIKLKG